ncbi:MAG: site-2 protease family protein [Proteobacteria bacterium]|nr:site-2 protease family protein [Pseudomonadota bacterium]
MLFDFGDNWLAQRVMWIVPLWLSLSVHEWAHAYCAFRLGDDTAARLGRMTINPLDHIDPVGTFLLPLLGVPFGWAKPVPINPTRFHRGITQSSGLALAAAAGPVSNLVLALCAVGVLAGIAAVAPASALPGAPARQLLEILVMLNLALAFFNALPITPLDGSRIADALMPPVLEPAWRSLQALGPAPLVVVLVLPLLLGIPLFGWLFDTARTLVEAAAGSF